MSIAAGLALLGGPALAAGNEPARLRVAGALVDDVVQSLLPVVLPESVTGAGAADSARPVVVLTETRYCGAGDKGAGRFRAVIRHGGSGAGSPPILPERDACRPSLADLAKRASAVPGPVEGLVIADLEATWKPWELKVALVRSVALGSPKSGRMPEFEDKRGLWTITTSDLRIANHAGEPIILHAAPSFAAAEIDIAVLLGERGPLAASRKSVPAALVGEANLSADVPVAFANQVLRRLTATQPLAISVDRDVVDLDKLSITQEAGGLTIQGDASPRSVRETAHVNIFVDGDDLRVASVRAQGQGDDCAGLGGVARIACNLRGSARGVVAEALGATLTDRYQGQLVRELAGQQDYRFNVGEQILEVRGDLLRLGSGAGSLSALARFRSGPTAKP